MKKSIANIVNHAEVSEKAIEAYLVKKTKEANLMWLKYSNANVTGYPDRLICLPFGQVIWVELKSKGKKPTKLQQIRHKELTDIGHQVRVISSKLEVDELMWDIEEWKKEFLNPKLLAEVDSIKVREYLENMNLRLERTNEI